MIKWFSHHWRLLCVVTVLARYRALFFLHQLGVKSVWLTLMRPLGWCSITLYGKPQGLCLARALESLGPSFIKLGQTLSARRDLLGNEVAQELAYLRDTLPPFSSLQAKEILAHSLNQPLEAVFPVFDETALAAASIAQVHRVEDPQGKAWAVKIVRPDIAKKLHKDGAFFRFILQKAGRRVSPAKQKRLAQMVDVFEQVITKELDLRYEAAAADEMRALLKDSIRIPSIDWCHSSASVLVMEYVEGAAIDDLAALEAAGHDRTKLLEQLAASFFSQVYLYGFFHADLHPGNMKVDKNSQIILLDFGIMGRLNKEMQYYLARMLVGLLKQDYDDIAAMHVRSGMISREVNLAEFAQACRAIGKPVAGVAQEKISLASMLAQMLQVTETYQITPQPQLLLLHKALLLVEGVARRLDPQQNFWELARPTAEKWAKQHMGPRGKMADGLWEVHRAKTQLFKLMDTLDQLSDMVTPQGIKLHPDMRPHRHQMLLHWGLSAMAGAAATYGVLWLIA